MLHYEIFGKGRETLILLHGFMESTEVWNEMQPLLSEDFQIVKIDLPGFGKSRTMEEVQTMEFFAEELKKIVDYLEISSFHLLGHSMGGYVALAFADKYAKFLKSFTLFFSTYFEDDAEKKNIREKSIRVIKENYRAFANVGIPNLFGSETRKYHPEKIEIAKQIAYTADIAGVVASTKGMMLRPNRQSVLFDFPGKIVLILGRHDAAVNAIKTLEELPDRDNIKAYILDCGHNGQWEMPTVCSTIINSELLNAK